jgi:hypothetical protein
MSYECLSGKDNAIFRLQYPQVADMAIGICQKLEAYCPDWINPKGDTALEVYPACGAVIVRDLLTVDLTSVIDAELQAAGVKKADIKGFQASGYGRAYASNQTLFLRANGQVSPTEERLAEVYSDCVGGEAPHFLVRQYGTDSTGASGYQRPHLDSGTRHPTVIFGTGPGFTRIADSRCLSFDPELSDFDFTLSTEHSTDLCVGPGDVGVFEGRTHMHGGMRDPDDMTTIPRRVLAVNVNSLLY